MCAVLLGFDGDHLDLDVVADFEVGVGFVYALVRDLAVVEEPFERPGDRHERAVRRPRYRHRFDVRGRDDG